MKNQTDGAKTTDRNKVASVDPHPPPLPPPPPPPPLVAETTTNQTQPAGHGNGAGSMMSMMVVGSMAVAVPLFGLFNIGGFGFGEHL